MIISEVPNLRGISERYADRTAHFQIERDWMWVLRGKFLTASVSTTMHQQVKRP